MELRRVTSALVRPQGSPLTSLLTPSSASRWVSGSQTSYRKPSNCSTRRNFNSTTPQNAIKPTATTTTTTPSPDTSSESQTTDIDKSASSLGWTTPSSRTLSSGRLSQSQEERLNGGSSADGVLKALNNAIKSSNTKSPSPFLNFSNMRNPNLETRPATTMRSGEMMFNVLNKDILMPPPPPRVPLDLKPRTGRTIVLNGNVDVGRGFRLLEQSCARNKVRSDFTRQRFHERGGLKRKRLRRERWRRKFMDGFRATVGRVKQLKQQGW